MPSRVTWTAAFLAAFCLHMLVAAGGAYLPELLRLHKKSPDIYNVKLVAYKPATRDLPHRKSAGGSPARQTANIVKRQKRPEAAPKKTAPRQQKREAVKKTEKRPAKKIQKPRPAKKSEKKAVKPRGKPAAKPDKERQRPSAEDLIAQKIKGLEEKVRQKQEEELLASRLAALAAKKGQKEEGEEDTAPGQGSAVIATDYGMRAKSGIMANFVVPPILRDKDLQAVVSIFVTRQGAIVRSVMRQRSGSEMFDHCVMKAVRDTKRLPPLPPELLPGPLEIEITFRSSD